MTLEGGCFCGKVRYRADEHTDSVSHCHCEHCRRASGGTVVTWVEVPRAGFQWTGEPPAVHAHESDWPTGITRTFCGSCGTSITYERDGSEYLDVTAASLDDPESVAPAHHVYTKSRISWFDMADELPRHERGRPESR